MGRPQKTTASSTVVHSSLRSVPVSATEPGSAQRTPHHQVIVDVLGADAPRLWDPAQPLVYADDLAAIRGDGVFETLMVRDGQVRNMQRHRERFLSSAHMLDLPEPQEERWLDATTLAVTHFMELVHAPEAALRWVYSRGRESTHQPTGWVMVTPVSSEIVQARVHGVKVMTAARGFHIDVSQRSPWALIGAKTLSYAANMAALRYAQAHGVQDVIFVSEEGFVLEGPTSSIIVQQGNTLVTPPIQAGVLPGTSQAALFRLASQRGWNVDYKPLTVEDLLAAEGVWMVSSVRVQARVTQLDGKDLPRSVQADEIEAMVTEAVVG